MLRLRVITAVVLLLILAAVLSAGSPWPMLGFLSLMCAVAFWEWLRMVVRSTPLAHVLGALALIVFAALAYAMLQQQVLVPLFFNTLVLPVAVLFWLLAAPLMIVQARVPASWLPVTLACLGLWLFAAAWYALAYLYLRHGAQALVSLWALIWWADIAAYFVGRSMGKTRLAPRVSPGKTWAGAVAGLLAATLWLLATAYWWPESYGFLLRERLAWPVLVMVGMALAAWSIVGDLFQSLLKRRAGIKDSSNLLPGHGGVYDRIDAVLPVVPAAVLLLIHG